MTKLDTKVMSYRATKMPPLGLSVLLEENIYISTRLKRFKVSFNLSEGGSSRRANSKSNKGKFPSAIK